jgi:DNA invertase Pin-like site-specific DNA recombinase
MDHTTHSRFAASYARVAECDDGRVRAQHAVNADAAATENYCIPGGRCFRFEDNGVSGCSHERTGWTRLVEWITSGKARFDRLYVSDWTRLGRGNGSDRRDYIELFRQHGVTVVSVA